MDYRSSRVCRSQGGRQGVRLAYDAVVFTGPSTCADRGGAGREWADTAVTRVGSCFPVLSRVQIAGGRQGVSRIQPGHASIARFLPLVYLLGR